MLHLSIIMNGTPSRHKPLDTEYGLSILVNYNDTHILFDTGYDDNFISNAEKMGYDLRNLQAVVLSHAHFNSVAGYDVLLERNMAPENIFIGSHFFEPKYVKNGPVFTNMNSTLTKDKLLKSGIKIKEVNQHLKLTEGLYLITCSARSPHALMSSESCLRYNGRKFVKDDFADEIALVAVVKEGLVLITSSCHRGICNAVNYIKRSTNRPVSAVIGGMTPAFTARELSYLKESGVKFIGICNERCNLEDKPTTSIRTIKVAVGDEFFF